MRKVLLLTFLAAPAFADGGITVQLPELEKLLDVSEVGDGELLPALAQAEVFGLNCPDFMLTPGEAALISGSVTLLADHYDLNPVFRHLNIYGPAKRMLNESGPEVCLIEGPKIKPLVEKLKAMGGGTDPIG